MYEFEDWRVKQAKYEKNKGIRIVEDSIASDVFSMYLRMIQNETNRKILMANMGKGFKTTASERATREGRSFCCAKYMTDEQQLEVQSIVEEGTKILQKASDSQKEKTRQAQVEAIKQQAINDYIASQQKNTQ